MQTPLSFCDITARFGQTPAPQKSIAEQTGWNPNQLFRDYLTKVRSQREKDEKEAIALAGQHGAEEAASWEHGRVFAGDVTPAFLRMLLQQPLPQDCGEAPKLTPFFSIFLDNGFCSEHYGTEVHIITEEDIP